MDSCPGATDSGPSTGLDSCLMSWMCGRTMRKLFLACVGLCGLAAPAVAADVAVLAPYPPPLRPLYSWTGCFIGFNIGPGAASQNFTDDIGKFAPAGASLGNHTGHGAVGGGQIGCDYQTGPFVFGVQGVYDLSGMKGSNVQPNYFPVEQQLRPDGRHAHRPRRLHVHADPPGLCQGRRRAGARSLQCRPLRRA